MITFQKVTRRVPMPGGGTPLTILNDLNLHIASGEAVAVVGPSGSGKSTFLTLCAGLERPTEGQVQVDGVDLAAMDEAQLARFRAKSLGFVFQSFHLLPHFTALENVMLPAEIAGMPNAAERAREALARVGLEARTTHRPLSMSGGEQQRVAIARAIVTRPPLLLCDEPTGNLDPDNADKIMDLILTLRGETKCTLVVVTHDREISRSLGRTLALERGRLK